MEHRFSILFLVLMFNSTLGGRLKIPTSGTFHGNKKSDPNLQTEHCMTLEQKSLSGILGAAYNPRYMSVVPPPDSDDTDEVFSDPKRQADSYRPFSVDEDFSTDVSEETPAWEVDHFQSDYFTHGRPKRELKKESNTTVARNKRTAYIPWECKSVIRWIDLGIDYFPRYIRNVECGKHKCWYDKFECRPKSFTVKMLRRKNGKCAKVQKKQGVHGLPKELKELWVWEERAVNFCCECAPKDLDDML